MAVVWLPYQHPQGISMFSFCSETTVSEGSPMRRIIWINHFHDKNTTQWLSPIPGYVLKLDREISFSSFLQTKQCFPQPHPSLHRWLDASQNATHFRIYPLGKCKDYWNQTLARWGVSCFHNNIMKWWGMWMKFVIVWEEVVLNCW
jgi:hypothetical protein